MELKAKDLRIGNYVSVRTSHVAIIEAIKADSVDVISIESEFKNQKSGEYRSSEHDYQTIGIPLTEEWLVKAGFEKTYESDYRIKYDLIKDYSIGFDFNKENASEDLAASGFRYFGQHFNHIKYVHQLQNLFFALTGQELEFKDITAD